jgi:hypothetical protein
LYHESLPHWLQHMPALSRFLLKTSNIHNFWFVSPKNMKFVLPQSLLQGASSQTSFKRSIFFWDQVMLPKTALSAIQTFSPLGIKKVTIGSWSYLVADQTQKIQLLIPWDLGDYNIQHQSFIFFVIFSTVNFFTPKLMKIKQSFLFLSLLQLTSKSSWAHMAQISTPYLVNQNSFCWQGSWLKTLTLWTL